MALHPIFLRQTLYCWTGVYRRLRIPLLQVRVRIFVSTYLLRAMDVLLYGKIVLVLTRSIWSVVERTVSQKVGALEYGPTQGDYEDIDEVFCDDLPLPIPEADYPVGYSVRLRTVEPDETIKTSEEEGEPVRKRRRIHTRRQPLSEDDKRRNHKISEQRRRRDMNHLLQEVRSLTPGIEQSSCSKSKLLESFADHMIKLKQENEMLSCHLKILEERL